MTLEPYISRNNGSCEFSIQFNQVLPYSRQLGNDHTMQQLGWGLSRLSQRHSTPFNELFVKLISLLFNGAKYKHTVITTAIQIATAQEQDLN